MGAAPLVLPWLWPWAWCLWQWAWMAVVQSGFLPPWRVQVGLAPTYGRVPDSSPDTLFGTMVKTGPIAATTRDAALAHAVMSQSVSSHIFTRLYGEPFGVPPVHLEGFMDLNLKGIRLGVFWDHFNDAEPLVVEACKAALETLKALGAEVVPVALPHLKALSLAHGLDISTEFSTFFGNLLYNGHNLEPGTRIQLGLGYTVSGVEFNSANILRGWALKYMHEELFTKLNVQAIVSPSMGILPPKMPEDVTAAGESNTPLIMQMLGNFALTFWCDGNGQAGQFWA